MTLIINSNKYYEVKHELYLFKNTKFRRKTGTIKVILKFQ